MTSQIDQLVGSEDPTKLFELLEELAVGSYGTVYKAKHKPSGDIVALKIITLEEGETFDDLAIEISILKMCSHPNIVKFYGGWKKGDELFIAMELCDGGAGNDLYQVLDAPVPENVIAFIMRESLKGLEYLHSKNIIHRDIKASNILLTSDGQVKLTDFGVSAVMANGAKRRTFIGTPYWMAPEVTTGTYIPYDTKADIWSLGVTGIEMSDLVPPNTHLAPMRAVLEIAKNPPPTVQHPELWSKEYLDFLSQLLVKEPEKRKTCSELLKHPWLAAKAEAGKQELIELITKIKKTEEEYRNAAEDPPNADTPAETEDNDDSSSTSHPSMRGVPEPPPREPSPGKAYGHTPNGTPRVGEQKSSRSSSNAPVMGMKKKSDEEMYESATVIYKKDDSTSSSQVTSPLPSPHKSSASSDRSDDTDSTWVRGSVPHPDRPRTLRTLKKSQAPQNIAAEKRMAQQLRELKKLTAQQNKEQEALQARHRSEREVLASKYDSKAKARDKQNKAQEKDLINDHHEERVKLEKQHREDQKLMQKQHRDEFSKRQSAIKDKLTKQQSEFSKQLKNKEALSLKALKNDKTLDKKLRKDKEQMLKEERLRDEQEFEFNLERDEMIQLHQLARKLNEEEAKLVWDHLIAEQQMHTQHLKMEHQVARDNLLLAQQQDVEQLLLDQQLERKHLLELEVQQTEHQNQQQAKVWEQLQKYLVVDHRNRTRAHKEKQKADQKEWLKQQKAIEKGIKDKKQLKQYQMEAKKKREAEIAAQDRAHAEELARDKAKQEQHWQELREEQAEQSRMLKEVHMRMMKSLQREQAERELKLQQDNFNAQVELQAQQFKQQMKLLTDQCAAQMQLRQSISNSALSLLQEQIHDQKQLLAMQHKAQMDLWQQHRGANLAELQKKHSEQIARFEKMHAQEEWLRELKQQIAAEESQLKAAHEAQTKYLAETQANMHRELEELHRTQREVLEQKLASVLNG